MDTGKIYFDTDGNECSILELVKREPKWAANRIQEGEAGLLSARVMCTEIRLAILFGKKELLEERLNSAMKKSGLCYDD